VELYTVAQGEEIKQGAAVPTFQLRRPLSSTGAHSDNNNHIDCRHIYLMAVALYFHRCFLALARTFVSNTPLRIQVCAE